MNYINYCAGIQNIYYLTTHKNDVLEKIAKASQ